MDKIFDGVKVFMDFYLSSKMKALKFGINIIIINEELVCRKLIRESWKEVAIVSLKNFQLYSILQYRSDTCVICIM